jgi:hypothetical protein
MPTCIEKEFLGFATNKPAGYGIRNKFAVNVEALDMDGLKGQKKTLNA